jgi:hypothetical protein
MGTRAKSGLAAACVAGIIACAPVLAAQPAAAASTPAPATTSPATVAASTAVPSGGAPSAVPSSTALTTSAAPATTATDPAATAAGAPPFTCNRHVDDAAPGPALDSPIALTPSSDSLQQIVNFGTDRTRTKYVREVVLTADKPLPATLTAQQLNFDAVISRAGATLESTDFPAPSFSTPVISPDRQSIAFEVCLNPGSQLDPGKYVGAVTLSGPAGLSAVSVSLTVNAKVAWLFYAWSAVALGAALLLLVLKDAAGYRRAHPETKDRKTDKYRSTSWGRSFAQPLADPLWWATTVVALGTAFGALYATYAGNPAWGAGGFSDYSALIGAGFAAIGGHTIISALTPSS